MQSGLVMTSMDARLFVVYELHLLHVMRPQMNLEWFWYMDVFSWMCMMVLQQRFCCFSTTNQRFLKLHFVSHFSGSCMTFSTSLMFLGFVEENDFLEKKLNSNKLNSTCGNGRTSDEFVLCRCLLLDGTAERRPT